MKPLSFALLALGVGAMLNVAHARPDHWHDDHDSDFLRRGFPIALDTIALGDEDGRFDGDVIDVKDNPRLECNLTHIRLSTDDRGVRIFKVIIKYRDSDKADEVDLTDFDDRHPHRWV